jgi:hypothetical protein
MTLDKILISQSEFRMSVCLLTTIDDIYEGVEKRAMAVSRGQGIRQALAQASSLSSTSMQPPKSRLYRIPHDILPDHFFTSKDSIDLGSCKYFNLRLRRLSQDVLDSVNRGPRFLAGAYPPGLLHARHEKYRLINHVKVDTWRTGEESEHDHQVAEEKLRRLSLQRIPVLKDGGEDSKIPTLVITSKKRVDKLSVVRHIVSKKLWRSFDLAVNELQGTPNEVQRGELISSVIFAASYI